MTWLCLLFVCMKDLDNVELILWFSFTVRSWECLKLFWGRGPTLPREVASGINPPNLKKRSY